MSPPGSNLCPPTDLPPTPPPPPDHLPAPSASREMRVPVSAPTAVVSCRKMARRRGTPDCTRMAKSPISCGTSCSTIVSVVITPGTRHLVTNRYRTDARYSPHPSAPCRPCLQPSERVPARSVPSKPPPVAPGAPLGKLDASLQKSPFFGSCRLYFNIN